MLKRITLSLLAVGCAAGAALSAEAPDYSDDRSTPGALVKSLYNAIARKEYGRAWSYYGDEKPAADFGAFAKGFATTESVEVMTGQATSEGAAGSVFYNLPVAIRAQEAGGDAKVFAGCYTVRQVSPALQEGDFKPMYLMKGTLAPSDSDIVDALPKKCGDGNLTGDDPVTEQAKAAFRAIAPGTCEPSAAEIGGGKAGVPTAYEIKYRTATDETDRVARLFAFTCSAGAYNMSETYFLWNEVDGMRQLAFASPKLDIVYDDPNNEESKVKSFSITGYSADALLVNSEYDPATKTITEYSKWRGVGDASSSGVWVFKDGQFELRKFEVDASYDGEMNPQTVVEFPAK